MAEITRKKDRRNIISFSGIINHVSIKKVQRTGMEWFLVKVLQSDIVYHSGSTYSKLQDNITWLSIFGDKGPAYNFLKSGNAKGLFILIKNSKITKLPDRKDGQPSDDKFSISTNCHNLIITENAIPTVNLVAVEGYVNHYHPVTQNQLRLDKNPIIWLQDDTEIIPVVLNDNSVIPSGPRAFIVGKYYGKTPDGTQIPHIAAETIISC